MSTEKDYVCTLDKASIKKAKDELNESPEDRLAAVQALREWIEVQPHITCPKTDTDTLLMFLRGTKFSQLKAREKFENSLMLKVILPKYFLGLDVWHPSVKTILESGYITALPKRTPQGCKIIMQRQGLITKLLGPLKLKMQDVTRFLNIYFMYLLRDEMTQINGMAFIIDFTGVTASVVAKMMDADSSKVHKESQKAVAGRFKTFHMYRAGFVIETLMAFWKPFMPKKFMERIRVHDTMENIYKDIPMDCLPIEFLPDDYTGPHVGHLDDINKTFVEELLTKEKREDILYRSSNAFWVDKSKKPVEKVTEHFRKLTVE